MKITLTGEKLNEGVTQKVIGEINGKKVMVKSYNHSEKEVAAEKLAYELGRKLGFHINKVAVCNLGKKIGLNRSYCSIHYWNESFAMEKHVMFNNDKTLKNKKYNGMVRAMHVFDRIMMNGDRHYGNFGVDKKNGYLFLIDHGFCDISASANETTLLDLASQYRQQKAKCTDAESLAVFNRILTRFVNLTPDSINKMLNFLPKNLNYVKTKFKSRLMTMQVKIKELMEVK